MTDDAELFLHIVQEKNEPGETPTVPETDAQPLRRKKPTKRRTLLLLIILAVLVAVGLVTYRNGTGLDILHRHIKVTSLGGNGDGTYGNYTFENDANSAFTAFGDALLVASPHSVRILDGAGGEIYREETDMEKPLISRGTATAAVYEAGGKNLRIYDGDGLVASLDFDEILAVTLNRSDWLAVTETGGGYKGRVWVYDDRQTVRYTYNSSGHFITDAAVTEDNKRLAAVAVGQEDGAFLSRILFFSLNSSEQESEMPLPDRFVTYVGSVKGKLAFVTDNGLTTVNPNGAQLGDYAYNDFYLRACSFGGDGYVTLLLGRYKSGNIGALMTLNERGELIAAQEVNREVLSLSAAGKYVAVLFPEKLTVYTADDMKIYFERENTRYRRVFLREDGTVMLVSETDACVLVP